MIKLLRYIKKYWFFAILAPLCMIGEVAMDLILAQYMEKMVDFGIQTSNMDNVVKYGLIMLAIVFAGVILGVLSGVFTNLAAFNFSNDLRKEVFAKIMKLSIHQSDDFKTGSLVTRVTNDITQVQNMIAMVLRGLIRATSFFVLGIIFTLMISLKFGIVILVLLPLEVMLIVFFVRLVFPIFKIIQQKLDKVNTIVHENVSGARVVKAFSKEPYEYDRFVVANNEYTEKNLYIAKVMAIVMPLFTLLVYGSQIVIYYLGGRSIFSAYKDLIGLDEMIMVGQITQANTYIMMICSSIVMLGMMFAALARAFASASRINEILDAPVDLEDGKEELSTLKEEGTIKFENVSFHYPESEKDILKNISFEIKQGETIAIVGSTGCGKSTLVNLLVRFYDVSEGKILVDNRDVRDFKQKDLRNIISICLQKAELFSGSIKENIAFGNEDASDDEINKVASISQAEDFITSKPQGIDSYVGEQGNELSGGQKQRVSIARALLKKPQIIIFDDSTSALDLVTEAKLHKALKKEMPNTTKIIIAQRIATAKNADKIIVLDDGNINGFDTHENLMKNNLIYQDIYSSQLKREAN